MRLTNIITIYFVMGAMMWGAGVIDYSQTGVFGVFIDNDNGNIQANESAVTSNENSGLLDNLIGPIRNALETVAGGTVIAVFGAIDSFLGFVAWPITVTVYIGAPDVVIALSGTFMVSFTFAVLRIFRASV